MKPQKDIFDLFRESEHKLNPKPSEEAWERLESRLDQHKKRSLRSIYRMLSIAAAVVILVASVSVIGFFLNPGAGDQSTFNLTSAGFSIEELQVETTPKENLNQIAAYHKKFANLRTNLIHEGNVNKKLVARTDNPVLENRRMSISGLRESAIAESSRPSSAKDDSMPPQLEDESSEVEELAVATPSKTHAFDSVYAGHDEMDEVVGYGNIAETDQVQPEIAMTEETIERTPETAYNRAQQTIPSAEQANRAKTTSKPKRKESMAAADDKAPASGISQFQWLTGKWQGNVNNNVSVEQWSQINDKTLEGKGFLMINNQPVFTENMKIQEIDGTVYFIADLNGTGNLMHYPLVSNDGFKAVFENDSIEFPKQVVLQRINSSNFSTIYQNTQPGSIDESQQNYFQNRNVIQKEQVVRNLSRVGD